MLSRIDCKKLAKILVRLSLVFVLTLGLSGCKYTDVMTEHIEDPVLGLLDLDMEPIYKDVSGAPPDPTRESSQVSNSERIDDQTAQLPNYSENPNNDNSTDQREHKEDTSHEQEATSGDEESEREGDNSTVGDGESNSTQNTGSGQDSSKTGQNSSQKQEAGDGPIGGDEATGGGGGDAQIWDTTGQFVQLPEHVGSVAAVGQYATIVQMLAGDGGLAVADDAWISENSSNGLFPDEGVSDLAVGWTKQVDGTYAINIDAIIAAKPDALLVDNTDVMLSEDEQKQLVAQGVNCIIVPNLGQTDTSDAAIVAAVNVVGDLLKNSTKVTYDTQAMANQYATLRNSIMENARSANGGYSFKMVGGTSYQEIYQCTDGTGVGQATTELSSNRISTAFVDGWMTSGVNNSSTAKRSYQNAELYLNGETMNSSLGVGVSASTSSSTFVLLDYYLQQGGVIDNAFDMDRPSAGESGSKPYVVIPGSSASLLSDQSQTGQRIAPSALWYSPTSYDLKLWSIVGDSDFPAVLVRDNEIAGKIQDSASLVDGLYNVGQPYNIVVVPSGACGSWADGNVESFLMSVWAYSAFRDFNSQSSVDDCVNSFYHVFYRVESGQGTSHVSDYKTVYSAACPTS